MRMLPRRLRPGEEATLVEHLGELRTRLVISLLAIVFAFVFTYIFRGHLLDWLNRPLPDRFHKPVTFVVVALSAVAALLAAGGLVFGYVVALPAAVHFLTNYDQAHYRIFIRARDYYGFASLVLLAVAVVFEVQLVVLGMVRIGFVSAQTLRRKWRHGLVAMAALAVALPGVDPVTTTFEMVP